MSAGAPGAVSPIGWLSTRARLLLVVGLLSLLPRIVLWVAYEPLVWPDTATYEGLAAQISTGNFEDYQGVRTPGYPLLLLIAGGDYRLIWLLQSLMGVSISLMLAAIILDDTHDYRLSALAALLASLSLNALFFEPNILTETLSTFLLVASLALCTLLRRGSHLTAAVHLLLGATLGLLALARPMYAYLLPFFVVFLLWTWARAGVSRTKRIIYLSGFLVPAVTLIVGWSIFNQRTTGYFGLSTLTGYTLTQHSGAFIELAPDRYATLRDIYLKYRARQIDEEGSYSGTIHDAWPEMLEVTGLSYAALSRELTSMSLELFAGNPALYLRSVGRSWYEFWAVPIYWDPSLLKPALLRSAFEAFWWVERWLIIALEFVFLAASTLVVAAWLIRRRAVSSLQLLSIACVIGSALVQAVLKFEENGRYALPTQPLVLYLSLYWLFAAAGSVRHGLRSRQMAR